MIEVKLWKSRRGKQVDRIERKNPSGIDSLVVLPDGRLASGGGEIRLLDDTGIETARLERKTGAARALAVLADGCLASGWHHDISIWDINTGTETARLEGHTDFVTSLAVLSDGRLASGSDDKTIRLWEVRSRKELTCLEVDAPVRCLVALPGCCIVAGDQLGRLHWLEIVN